MAAILRAHMQSLIDHVSSTSASDATGANGVNRNGGDANDVLTSGNSANGVHTSGNHGDKPGKGGGRRERDDYWRERMAGRPSLEARYRLGRELGRGHFGVVRECVDRRTGNVFACKTILKSRIETSDSMDELQSEVMIPLPLEEEGEEEAARNEPEEQEEDEGNEPEVEEEDASRNAPVVNATTHQNSRASASGEQPRLFSRESPSPFVRVHAVFESSQSVHLLMDYCSGGDLFDHVAKHTRLSERQAAAIMSQLARAVHRMHESGVVHRDLKPENILLCGDQPPTTRQLPTPVVRRLKSDLKPENILLCSDSETPKPKHSLRLQQCNCPTSCPTHSPTHTPTHKQPTHWRRAPSSTYHTTSCFRNAPFDLPLNSCCCCHAPSPITKIADFGMARQIPFGTSRLRGIVGSPFYMAPEVVKGQPYGSQVDVWSLGVILHLCLSGSLPFQGKNHNAVFAAICSSGGGGVDLHTGNPWPLISHEAKHLVRRMLEIDPSRRIRAGEVVRHPWFRMECPGHLQGYCSLQHAHARADTATQTSAAAVAADPAAAAAVSSFCKMTVPISATNLQYQPSPPVDRLHLPPSPPSHSPHQRASTPLTSTTAPLPPLLSLSSTDSSSLSDLSPFPSCPSPGSMPPSSPVSYPSPFTSPFPHAPSLLPNSCPLPTTCRPSVSSTASSSSFCSSHSAFRPSISTLELKPSSHSASSETCISISKVKHPSVLGPTRSRMNNSVGSQQQQLQQPQEQRRGRFLIASHVSSSSLVTNSSIFATSPKSCSPGSKRSSKVSPSPPLLGKWKDSGMVSSVGKGLRDG